MQPANEYQKYLLSRLSYDGDTHNTTLLGAVDDFIHRVISNDNDNNPVNNAAEVATDFLDHESGRRFWPDQNSDPFIQDHVAKLIVSRWYDIDLLSMDKSVADARYHNALVQVLSPHEVQPIDLVIRDLKEWLQGVLTSLSLAAFSKPELKRASEVLSHVNVLIENFNHTMLEELKKAMNEALKTLVSAKELLKCASGSLFTLRRESELAWPRSGLVYTVQLASEILCQHDTLCISLQSVGPEENGLMEACFMNNLYFSDILTSEATFFYITKGVTSNLTVLSRINALRFKGATKPDYSSLVSDARSLKREPYAHIKRMMGLAENDGIMSYESLHDRIEEVKSINENAKGDLAFGSITIQDTTYEERDDPRQIMMDLLERLPTEYRPDTAGFGELDDNAFIFACADIMGQLCGILLVWPCEFQQLAGLCQCFRELEPLAKIADEERLYAGHMGVDEGYDGTDAESSNDGFSSS